MESTKKKYNRKIVPNQEKVQDSTPKESFTLDFFKFSVKQTNLLFISLGILLFAFTLFALISCISYLFTWQKDQAILYATSNEIRELGGVSNLMGTLGAKFSNFLVFRGFGLGSFFLIPIFYLISWSVFTRNFKTKYIKLFASFLFSMLLTSLLLTLFSRILDNISDNFMELGGLVGYQTYIELSVWIGDIGASVLIIIGLLVTALWTFPEFLLKFILPKKEEVKPKENEKENLPIFQNPDNFEPSVQATNQEQVDIEENEFDNNDLNEVSTQSVEKVKFEIITESHNTNEKETEEEEEEIAISSSTSMYKYPNLEILSDYTNNNRKLDPREIEQSKDMIVNALESFKIKIDKISATIGPTVTLYEIVPASGIRISKIRTLEDDIAMNLAALKVRIIAPMPGKGTIGIEVPNTNREIVGLRDALLSPAYQNSKAVIPLILGKNVVNEVIVQDLTKMPHLLIAGATGQGKSVGINVILSSILFKMHPEDVKLILIDPKKVELSLYSRISKHFMPEFPDGFDSVITDNQMVIDVLKSLLVEMDSRYNTLKECGLKHIREYNHALETGQISQADYKRFPYIVLVIDEFADLMMTAGKEVELPIARLAQLARAVGIHLIIATQRPSVNVITGIIKANFPARLAFKVSSKIDSRTILDAGGADQLIGMGDMLFSANSEVARIQCPFIDTNEIDKLVEFIEKQPYPMPYKLNIISDVDGISENIGLDGDIDPMLEDAARMVVTTQQGSTSMLQRKLKLGFNRAGRIMDQLEALKIVGPSEGGKPREVLVPDEYTLDIILNNILKRGI